jgi:hypothetical protein
MTNLTRLLTQGISGLLFMAVCGVGTPVYALEEKDPKEDHKAHASSEQEDHAHHAHQKESHDHASEKVPFTFDITAEDFLKAGENAPLTLYIKNNNGKYIKESDLKIVHEKPIHLLVIDSSLTDYHHLHPIYNRDGFYKTSFIPNKSGIYKVFADITPVGGKQIYLPTEISVDGNKQAPVDKTIRKMSEQDGYTFTLDTSEGIHAGKMAMLTLNITKEGKPITTLEPLMGAFAHMVGFQEDRLSVEHIHPMGHEAKTPQDQAKSPMMFHLMAPQKAGFLKLFAQVKLDGKEFFIPFSVMVQP